MASQPSISLAIAAVAAPITSSSSLPAAAPASGDDQKKKQPQQQPSAPRAARLWLVRHGQTDWNAAGRIQGHTPTDINATGIEQAQQLAKYLQPIRFTAAYSSDLPRASTTAKLIISKSYTPGLAITELAAIRERCFGVHEGKDSGEIRKLFGAPEFTEEKMVADGVETDDAVWARASAAFREIATRHNTSSSSGDDSSEENNNNVLVVCHGGVLTRTVMTTLGLPLNAPRKFGLNNGLVVIIDVRPADFFLLSLVDLPLVHHGIATPNTIAHQ